MFAESLHAQKLQLLLFNEGAAEPLDLNRLRFVYSELLRPVHAVLTKQAYAKDWRGFADWCDRTGRESLPASSDTLALYITWMLMDRGRKVSTASRHSSAVMYYHRNAGLPLPSSAALTTALASVKRSRKERSEGKAALSPLDLVRVVQACSGNTNAGLRDRAVIVLGFATSLRRVELAALQLADIAFKKEGLIVFVEKSKTDQEAAGRFIGVWPGRRACTDPVRVLRAWLKRRGSWPGPLFPRVMSSDDSVGRQPIAGAAVNEIVKRAIKRAGLDPAGYGAHSLRAGAITAAAEAGSTDQEIMHLSGHVSHKVMSSYIRRSRLFAGRNPLAGVL